MLSISPSKSVVTILLFTVLAPLVAALPVASPVKRETLVPRKQNVYDFSLVDQDGKVVPLASYKGKVLLIVNLASQSFYHTQIAALNDLQKTYGPEGLQVLGIPSGDFAGQELKKPAAMRKYYETTVHAAFPVFAKSTVTGVQAIPLFQYLCDPKEGPSGGDLRWSYTKFLIGRDGEPLARYELAVDPGEVDFHVAIEEALAGTFKRRTGKQKAKSDGYLDSSTNE